MAGSVDQSGSMLSDDVAQKGYALLCMAVPQSDCKIMTVSEVRVRACACACLRMWRRAGDGCVCLGLSCAERWWS
jgi:hypothetical protein